MYLLFRVLMYYAIRVMQYILATERNLEAFDA